MEDEKDFMEKRTYPRYKIDFPVECHWVKDGPGANAWTVQGKKEVILVRDISLGGMRVAFEKPMQVGDVLVVKVPLPGDVPALLAMEQVVWTRGNLGGLRNKEIGV